MTNNDLRTVIFLTPDNVAKRLSVTKPTVLRLIRSGELRALRISARTLRISEAAFEEFLTKRQKGPQ